MKKIILFLLLAIPALSFAEEKQDTTFTVSGRNIVVSDTLNHLRIAVYDSLGRSLKKTYETEYIDSQQVERFYVMSPFIPRLRNNRFESTLPGFFGGYQSMTSGAFGSKGNANLHLKHSRSYEIRITLINLVQPLNRRNTLGLQYGLQFAMNKQSLDRDVMLVSPGVAEPWTGDPMKKNYLKWGTISLPVLLDFQDQYRHHNFFVGAGLSLDYRYSLKAKSVFNTTNHGHYSIRHRLPMNPWGLSLHYHIGYGIVQLYMQTALTPFVKMQNGTHYYPHSIGLGLTF